jgi:hypothetical protein
MDSVDRRGKRAVTPSNPCATVLLCAASAILLSACSTSKLAVGSMVPVLENTSKAAMRADDPALVEDALPTSILLLEGMHETDPGNHDVARLASMFDFAHAFGFLESVDTLRASSLYDKGRTMGWKALDRPEIEQAIRSGTLDEMHAALPKLKKDDAPAMLWTAANWAGWMQLNLQDPTAAADFSRLLPFAERLAELDDTAYWGMPRVLLGSIHAARPVALGGNLERARTEFDRAYAISGRNLLLAQVFEAKTYCVQAFDATCYESRLREVLDAPAKPLPDAELLNQIARREASRLIERTEEIFE